MLTRMILTALLTLGSAGFAQAENKIVCTHYVYADVPFATVTLHLLPNGHIDRLGEITHYGQTKTTSVEEHQARDGELYNMTVDADSGGNGLQLIVSQKDSNGGKEATLINQASPIMKEMPGICTMNAAL